MLVPRLRLALEQKTACEKRLAQLLDELGTSETDGGEIREPHDAAIMLSFPGLGAINVAVLLAEAWQAIVARDDHALRAYSGQAPVTRESGKRLHVVFMPQACNDRLRDAMYPWARVASQTDAYSKA